MLGAGNGSARGEDVGSSVYRVELPLGTPQTECRPDGGCAVQLIAR